ncbi:MAG: hypothetical protein WBO50_00125, partial [Nitrospira sp.]
RCIIGRHVRIEAGAHIEDSVILDHARIGAKAHLRRVVIDRNNEIPAGVELGHGDREVGPNAPWMASDVMVFPKPDVRTELFKRRLSSH